MSSQSVKVVTFDLWDTIVIDDSDEPKRAAQGLPSKPEARRALVHEYLSRHEPIDRELVDRAYDVTDAAFNKVWHDQHVTWTIRERLRLTLTGLGRDLPQEEFVEMAQRHEVMELEYRPDPVPGVVEAIYALKSNYRLAIISDAIVSPARCLKELLNGMGLLECFDAFAFSDEVGRSKPHPSMFEHIASQLGCELSEMLHIGDREHNDVGGPHAVGARAVLLTVAKDRGSDDSKADAICNNYSTLSGLVDGLAGS